MESKNKIARVMGTSGNDFSDLFGGRISLHVSYMSPLLTEIKQLRFANSCACTTQAPDPEEGYLTLFKIRPQRIFSDAIHFVNEHFTKICFHL